MASRHVRQCCRLDGQSWADTWDKIDSNLTNSTDSLRVYKGGGWYGVPWFARLAYRYWYDPAKRLDVLGFLLCRTLQ